MAHPEHLLLHCFPQIAQWHARYALALAFFSSYSRRFSVQCTFMPRVQRGHAPLGARGERRAAAEVLAEERAEPPRRDDSNTLYDSRPEAKIAKKMPGFNIKK